MTRVVLLNGAPGSGKDTLCSEIIKCYSNAIHLKYANYIKDLVHTIYGLDIPAENLSDYKDVQMEILGNRTPRELYIAYGELIKDLHGADVFGNRLADRIRQHKQKHSIVAVSDCGFGEEVYPVAKEVGYTNVLLVRVHRPGCNFDNDSRSFVFPEGVYQTDIVNNGTETEFYSKVADILDHFLEYAQISP